MTPPSPAPTPAASAPKITGTQVASEITVYGGIVIGVLEALMNTLPSVSVPGYVQAILSAVVAVLTALLTGLKASEVNKAAAGRL